MKNKIERDMLRKLYEDLFSIKFWSITLATGLLLSHYLTGTHWVTVLTSVLSLREVASYRYESNSTQNVEVTGEQPKE